MQDLVRDWGPLWGVIGGAGQILAIMVMLLLTLAFILLFDRKVWAAVMMRKGPNVVGPFGLLQSFADFLKFVVKEIVIPAGANKTVFILAPLITITLAFVAYAVVPFAPGWVISDMNVGILYLLAMSSLGVYGIIMGGWASNSKYPFLGGIRSSAQMISYEIAMGLSVVPIFLLTESLNLGDIVKYQADHGWMILKQPVAFVIFLIAAFAETNRLPFDLPESETELVGGYHTEYSSMKFALFFLGEYANMIASSAMMVTLFCGGWTLPGTLLSTPSSSILVGLLHIGVFLAKMAVFMIVFIWVRWMLPRFRYDQLMDIGWRRFIPVALANILLTAVVVAL
jgi:NADH-quinone oxidoreductase subunit H